MKRTTRIAAFLCLAAGGFAASPAQAQMYWRIDAGWSEAANRADFKDNDFNNSGNIWTGPSTAPQPGTVSKIHGSLIVGAGVGYRFAGGLRGDVTFAYRPLYALDGVVNDSDFDILYRADIESTTLMVNGYYDFTAGRVRPYIGAGIGWARNETETLTQDFRTGFANTFSGATKQNTAVALMMGVAIPCSGWTLDIGYRYIDLGKFRTGSTAALGITGGHTGKLSAHEFTLGVRF
jgi:opacity protein-like surface antigen